MARPVTAVLREKFQTEITVGPHRLTSDTLPEDGGGDAGPSPGELLLAALGA
jgi:putative redox protein